MTDSFYRSYEERHRGSRELIISRLRAYSDFIAPLLRLQVPATALDLGCGRGEWLELLGEAGFAARGVDLDEGMLAACRERALDVEMADAVTSLCALPDASVALVSAFHLVEHMPFATVQILIREALRVLQPGGLLIMETPNPENLVVGASSFYMDPTHVRPVPPQLLDFAVEYSGFVRHKIVRLQEAPQLHTAAPIGLIDVLDGVSPDYAVVAQKDTDADTLSMFDAPFGVSYGMSLTALARRYDARVDTRISELKNSLARIETDTAQNLQDMQVRLAQLETQLDQAGQQLHAIFSSSSWRITAPLRLVASGMPRFRSNTAVAWVIRGSKKTIRNLLRRTGQTVLRHPYLKKTTLGMLERWPRLRARLYGVVHGQATAPDPTLTGLTPDILSPRALHIYLELKNLINGKKI